MQTTLTAAAISVSELNRQTKRLLEVSYSRVWVIGEISNFSRPSSGHWYFTLKDDKAQVRCAMFKNHNMSVRFRPKDGDLVVIEAKASLYEGRGEYQLITEAMQPAGEGALQKEFEKLKARLGAEGLFDVQHKKAIPAFPRVIGVITSATGAAIHDILSVAKRRFPATAIHLYPVQVQGTVAGQEICQAITLANKEAICDVLIVGRGGGSLEDLWAFNEERVARAIYASQLPIVSAVGHEVDFTIADFVADWRAPTPSAAAERLTPDQTDINQRIDTLELRLVSLMNKKLSTQTEKLSDLTMRLKSPRRLLSEKQQRLSEIEARLKREMRLSLARHQTRLLELSNRVAAQHPLRTLASIHERVTQLGDRLNAAQETKLRASQQRFTYLAAQLHTLSPLSTIARGYSILRKADGQVVSHIKQIALDESLNAYVNGGSATVKVTDLDAKSIGS